MTTYIGTRTRIVVRNGRPWFVLDDVCGVLDLPDAAADDLPIAELDTAGVQAADGFVHQVRVVSPEGVQLLVDLSETVEAAQFKEVHGV